MHHVNDVRAFFSAMLHACTSSCMPSRRAFGLPGSHRPAPINAFEQHRQLCVAQMHRATARLWPHEATTLQSLGIQVHAVTAPPQYFQQIAALAAEHEYITGEGSLAQHRLHQRRQPIHPLAHISDSCGNPHSSVGWQSQHQADSASITSRNTARSIGPLNRSVPRASSISIAGLGSAIFVGTRDADRALTTTGSSVVPGVNDRPYPPCWYFTTHLRTMLALARCANATPANDAPGSRHSHTIATFCAIVRRRRGLRSRVAGPLPCSCVASSMVSAYSVVDTIFTPISASAQDVIARTLTIIARTSRLIHTF